MMFWILAALLTAAVTMLLLSPLARGRADAAPAAGHDVEVYRDQLAELDRDLRGGLISASEAEAARAEIARRLLKAAAELPTDAVAAGAAPVAHRAPGRMSARAAGLVVVVLIPLIGLAGYLEVGNPGIPAQPLSARLAGPDGDPELASLVAKAEAHVSSHPDDGEGWDVLAPIYFRTGRLSDAETAFRNAIQLLGSSAARQTGLGETLLTEAEGQMTPEAEAAFREAVKLDPKDPKPAFYLAVALAQAGKKDEAVAAFKAMEAKAPADAPWLPAVRGQIAALTGQPAGAGEMPPMAADAANGAGAAPGNPSADDVAAAQSMNAGDRMQMIKGMVAQLDARLREQPDNFEGWMRLVRSYMVLQDQKAAEDALKRGLQAFPADSDNGKALIALAGELGLEVEKVTQ